MLSHLESYSHLIAALASGNLSHAASIAGGQPGNLLMMIVVYTSPPNGHMNARPEIVNRICVDSMVVDEVEMVGCFTFV